MMPKALIVIGFITEGVLLGEKLFYRIKRTL